jgi:hypothetical protein
VFIAVSHFHPTLIFSGKAKPNQVEPLEERRCSEGLPTKIRLRLTLLTFANALAYCDMELMEQHAFKNENISLNTNIYSYLEAFGGQSSNLCLNVVHFFNTCVNYTSVAA